uniref:Class I SAM-dependent methyltransferase n=1 Tax=Phenylobacterium glaciei TaxID=2803784 RepID=A0A974P6Z6_9CAUL|nr:class I SAM-dependent methyltransferase [Phenylobacterium glaciei]
MNGQSGKVDPWERKRKRWLTKPTIRRPSPLRPGRGGLCRAAAPEISPRLTAFLAALPAGAHILDLGCGGGQDSQVMLAQGFEVTPIDGSAGLARIASDRLGRPVRVQLFEDLEDEAVFDGIWANASLLHVPTVGLPRALSRVRRALKPGGLFHATYKAGDGAAAIRSGAISTSRRRRS